MLTKEKRTTTKAKTSTTKVTPRFYSHFSVIPSHGHRGDSSSNAHTTVKQVISYRGLDESGGEMYRKGKRKKARAKRAKLFFVVKYANL